MGQNTVAVTDSGFQQDVLKSSTPVLLDFWAEWCGPCRALSPALEEIAGEMAGRLVVAKMDIDANPNTPTEYKVRGIPTLILFKDGKPVATKVGGGSKSQLKDWVTSNL